jgi:hypothetical protein
MAKFKQFQNEILRKFDIRTTTILSKIQERQDLGIAFANIGGASIPPNILPHAKTYACYAFTKCNDLHYIQILRLTISLFLIHLTFILDYILASLIRCKPKRIKIRP